MSACIIIPIYKSFETLDKFEIASLERCFTILKAHQIFFICSQSFNPQEYSNYANRRGVFPGIQRFSDKFFVDVKGYNTLMLKSSFYRSFLTYDFMLIHQTDAYVFKDELGKWCAAGIDYVGAPWLEHPKDKSEPILTVCGNGGLSLRNIRKHYVLARKIEQLQLIDRIFRYSLLSRILPTKSLLLYFWKMSFQPKDGFSISMLTNGFYTYNEDGNWSLNIALSYGDFVVADPNTAMKFAFEKEPQFLYIKNNNELPFGCHAFQKYDWMFWSQHIILDNAKQAL